MTLFVTLTNMAWVCATCAFHNNVDNEYCIMCHSRVMEPRAKRHRQANGTTSHTSKQGEPETIGVKQQEWYVPKPAEWISHLTALPLDLAQIIRVYEPHLRTCRVSHEGSANMEMADWTSKAYVKHNILHLQSFHPRGPTFHLQVTWPDLTVQVLQREGFFWQDLEATLTPKGILWIHDAFMRGLRIFVIVAFR